MDPQIPTQQTQKQQVTDILRQSHNVVVTVSQKPDVDQIAAAIALSQILNKLNKRVDAVVTASLPDSLSFLQTSILHKTFTGIRDFVISVDTSKTEADKLKYVPEGGKLNIYITPFNGNFSNNDVSFSYGDYHVESVVVLGANTPAEIDSGITSQTKLLEKVRLISIHAQAAGPSTTASNMLEWGEPASSICEMLMSLTEALQSGLVDAEIATSLLTGIIAKTDHFTNDNTTPKIMTMAAQLMASGARRADIIKNLKEHLSEQATANFEQPSTQQPKTNDSQANINNQNAASPQNNSVQSQSTQTKPVSQNQFPELSQTTQAPSTGTNSNPNPLTGSAPNIQPQPVSASIKTADQNNQPASTQKTTEPLATSATSADAKSEAAAGKTTEETKAKEQANEAERISAIEAARKAVAEAAKSASSIEQSLESNVQNSLKSKAENPQNPANNQTA